ncbi:hypothetical protein ACTPEM_24190 [Clostridioides difficile]
MKMVKKLILSTIMALVLVLTIGCSNAEEKVKSNFEAELKKVLWTLLVFQ